MKNNDSNDPLKEKEKEKEQSTNQKTKKLEEEKETQPEQENLARPHDTPAVESVNDSSKNHTSLQETPESTPKTEPASKSEPDPPKEQASKFEPEENKGLIEDNEEQKNNESYDDLLDKDDRDENEDESKEPDVEEEGIKYSLLSREDLVKLLREKLDNPGKGNLRKEVEAIKRAFYEKYNISREEKKRHFLDEGGNPEDFKPVADPLESEIKELLKKYRGLKAEFTRQLEKTKQENLHKKQDILEELRLVMGGQESFEFTFRKFKDLQKQWFSTGIVPQQNLKDLWDSYNYFVDKFNDYVRINRELRAMDLKKNLELKINLCKRAEELDNEPNVIQAFKSLQKYHARWREIGPVPRENRDEIWERFKQATSLINRKHQEYHSKLKESLYDNLARKVELCEKVEALAAKNYNSHGAWVEKTRIVLEIQKIWKTIGYAPKKDNNMVYARFRRACDTFFGNKARFYSDAFEEQKENFRLKSDIAEKAESLCMSENWKETTTELIRLQKQWKEIGPVPRRDSDKLWKRFRGACDTFFNRKSKYFENIDSTFDENLKVKESIVKEMDAFKPAGDREADMASLEDFQERFNTIGYVPVEKKDWIKDQYRLSLDRLMERIGMDEFERSVFKFRNRISGMIQSPRTEMKLNFERDKLLNKLQQLRSDIGLWENNIGFFKQSDSSEETIQGLHEKIESARERILLLEKKIRILDDMENEN